MTTNNIPARAVDPSRTVNWNWSIADMDRLQDMAKRKVAASKIADAFETTVEDVRAVCARNGLIVYPLIWRQA